MDFKKALTMPSNSERETFVDNSIVTQHNNPESHLNNYESRGENLRTSCSVSIQSDETLILYIF